MKGKNYIRKYAMCFNQQIDLKSSVFTFLYAAYLYERLLNTPDIYITNSLMCHVFSYFVAECPPHRIRVIIDELFADDVAECCLYK